MSRPGVFRIATRTAFALQRRCLHRVPPLRHDFSEGVPGLFSAPGFDIAWTQNQSLMIEKLNSVASGKSFESKTPKDILLMAAREPALAAAFNYASMAHNNAFFFNGLSPVQTDIPSELKACLERDFSSIETLRTEMITIASVMFGPGFLWLCKTREGKFTLLTTYLAGSPYPGAHFRRQAVDMNTQNDGTVAGQLRSDILNSEPVNTAGAFGNHATKKPKMAPGGIDLLPVLCVNLWEHVYLPDYGLGANFTEDGRRIGGKKAFVESWWHTIDWNVVAALAELRPKGPQNKFTT
ncbi:hypothetical protein BP5796_09181 [Coleophoma crateriformis]|uniref:Manganese/iron superoxide dismutase C-terminal domain-containing protein n=1 Tax=Coleophoma crateriformis TaxID=565419 RepID=A0A3D8R3Y2_9HELO|nr:hypothetical protein BP5796_09181 [Coleophoma crateriformis]